MPEGPTASTTPDIVRALHDSPHRGVVYATGGGSLMLSDLLQVPGASATLLEGQIPYSQDSLATLLGAPPDQACSPETARDLAMCAYLRAQELAAGPEGDTFGFAITASLGSTRPKKGEHRAHYALQTSARTHTITLNLAKGERSREAEERLVADIALAALAEALHIDARTPELRQADTLETHVAEADADMQALLDGKTSSIAARTPTPKDPPKAILPGAFNPLHEGHRRMAEAAAGRLGERVAYELCIRNVDKPPLNFHDMHTRRDQFGASEDVWLTNASTFVEKARVFGGVTFVVGADTMCRIAEAKYYEHGDVGRAVDELAETECRFLVFGRVFGGDQGGRFVTLGDLELPDRLRAMSEGVSEAEFRSDVSSTALRARRTSHSAPRE